MRVCSNSVTHTHPTGHTGTQVHAMFQAHTATHYPPTSCTHCNRPSWTPTHPLAFLSQWAQEPRKSNGSLREKNQRGERGLGLGGETDMESAYLLVHCPHARTTGQGPGLQPDLLCEWQGLNHMSHRLLRPQEEVGTGNRAPLLGTWASQLAKCSLLSWPLQKAMLLVERVLTGLD